MNTSYMTVKEIEFYKKCASEYNIKNFSDSTLERFDHKKQLLFNKSGKPKTQKKEKTK
jgi:hypothetical protein